MVCYFSCVRQIFLLQFSRTRATEWRLIYYIRGNVISNQPSAMQPRRHLIPVFVEGTGCFGKGKYWLVYAGKWASAWPGVWHVKFLPFCWVQFSKNRWWRTCGEIYIQKCCNDLLSEGNPLPDNACQHPNATLSEILGSFFVPLFLCSQRLSCRSCTNFVGNSEARLLRALDLLNGFLIFPLVNSTI